MIAFVKGTIESITEDTVILDTGNIGYNIKVPTTVLSSLPGIGQELKLYTYTCVREDAFLLYGFLTRDDLEMFKRLISVSGIGPKGGLAILSTMTIDDLRFAILSGDAKAIAKAPGIGPRTVSHLITDLRDKISAMDTSIGQEIVASGSGDASDIGQNAKKDAIEALKSLGYSASDALKAIQKTDLPQDADVETILKAALKNMF